MGRVRFIPLLAVACVLFSAPVGAAPVAVGGESPSIESTSVRLSSVGRDVLPVQGGYVVLSEADLGLTEVSFVAVGTPLRTAGRAGPELVVLGEVAAQGTRLVAVDTAGRAAFEAGEVESPLDPVLRIFRIPSDELGSFEETGVAVLPDPIASGIRRFGTALAIGGNAIAVVSETTSSNDRVDIFRISQEGTAAWSQELNPRTLDTSVAVSTSGATIALSGVNRLAASGEVIVNRIGPAGWVPTQRFLRIGGGPVLLKNDRMVVQRNSFFARPSGPWTVIDSLPGRPFEVRSELPVEGSAVDFIGGLVVVGDPENELVFVLEETGSDFRFTQAIRPQRAGSSGDSSRFGTSVALLGAGSLVVGAPGPGASSPAGEVHVYSIADGPVGCTIVGTDGSDELSTEGLAPGSHTVCGLGGDDVLTGSQASDTLLGGSGDDTLTASAAGGLLNGGAGIDSCVQTTPATGPVTTIDCEP
ncbi:MAG: hypothetical protein ACR2NL_01775 [Acidimicrobiia bacterium]